MALFLQDHDLTLYHGDVLDELALLPDGSVDVIVTSPPYFNLRDYGVAGQIGLEGTVEEYIASLVAVFREARRVLAGSGVLWLNLGDSYAANRSYQVSQSKHQNHDFGASGGSKVPVVLKAKDMMFIPTRAALALQADGWWARQDVIWEKPNALPESVTDRPACSHEHLFMLAKAERYFYDHLAVKEPAEWSRWGAQTNPKGTQGRANLARSQDKQALLAQHAVGSSQRHVAGFNDRWDEQTEEGAPPDRNLRSVWSIPTEPNTWAACTDCDAVFTTSNDANKHEELAGHTLAPHFAAFPRKLVATCLRASCPPDGTVLDPFAGSGTTLLVARALGHKAVGIELREAYCRMIRARAQQLSLLADPMLA